MNPYYGCLIIILASVRTLNAEPILTLDDALVAALKNNPQLVEAGEAVDGADARAGQVLSGYYPQVSIAADWSRGRSYLTALQNIRTTEVNTDALYLKQTIYDFGRTAGAVAAARSNREAAGKGVAVTRQDLALRVRSAFYLLLAAEKQVTTVKATVGAREEVHRQAREFFRQGIRAKVDVTRAEANLFAARTALIRAANNRDMARVELANAMGMPALGEYSLAEPPLGSTPLPARDRSLAEAMANRAELHLLAAQKSAAEASLKAAKGSYLPILTGTASIGYADREFPPNGSVWGVGLNLTVPLFSGFSSVMQVREARAGIGAIEARLSTLRLQIGKEVESAWLGANEAAARIASIDKEVAAAEENRALAEGRYHEGVGSIIEVTDAQSQALEAQTAHIQAGYDYRTALARLDRAMGKE